MRTRTLSIACVWMVSLVLLLRADASGANRPPVSEPELRIINVTVSPEAYVPRKGVLNFVVQIELPRDLDDDTLLEISTLISSPSKRFMRFLVSRQPVSAIAVGQADLSTPPVEDKLRARVLLTWDGRDQRKEFVPDGHYQYEVEAKLLAKGERGSRTFMNAWSKRGVIKVK